jgi:hypothetical protein
MDTWLEIARFLLIGHWYGTLVTVDVLIVLYLLHKLLLRYPLLDTLFPWCCDNWCAPAGGPNLWANSNNVTSNLISAGEHQTCASPRSPRAGNGSGRRCIGRRTFSNAEAGAITRGCDERQPQTQVPA